MKAVENIKFARHRFQKLVAAMEKHGYHLELIDNQCDSSFYAEIKELPNWHCAIYIYDDGGYNFAFGHREFTPRSWLKESQIKTVFKFTDELPTALLDALKFAQEHEALVICYNLHEDGLNEKQARKLVHKMHKTNLYMDKRATQLTRKVLKVVKKYLKDYEYFDYGDSIIVLSDTLPNGETYLFREFMPALWKRVKQYYAGAPIPNILPHITTLTRENFDALKKEKEGEK